MEQAIDFGLLEKINYKLDLLMDGLEKSETSDWPLYMDTTMAAKYLAVSYDTMARLGRIGAVKHKSVGSKRIYKRDWLDAYMER
ncbi:DNA binding domain protein, excisionase family [Peptoniphilus sp. oral taxon 375 str. F0436]|nr:DNA binding domain protein, excisionase family [Peptoniphilus sp. oral taxon 375 str. F0436]